MIFVRSGPILVKKLFKLFTISFLFELNLLLITKLFGNVLPVKLPVTFLNIFCFLNVFLMFTKDFCMVFLFGHP